MHDGLKHRPLRRLGQAGEGLAGADEAHMGTRVGVLGMGECAQGVYAGAGDVCFVLYPGDTAAHFSCIARAPACARRVRVSRWMANKVSGGCGGVFDCLLGCVYDRTPPTPSHARRCPGRGSAWA